MRFFLSKYFSLTSILIIPLIIFWNTSWLSLMGYQAYWPIFWLLPWALINGPFKSMILGLILGLILDSIYADLYTQIPGLVICGFWFGKFGGLNQSNYTTIQLGLIASIGSLICGLTYFAQIFFYLLLKNSPFLLFTYGFKNIFAQVLLTGLMAPLFCNWLYFLFSRKDQFKI